MLRVWSNTQSPAPSSTTPSGICRTLSISPRALQRTECRLEVRLLALALRMAEARQQHLAVEHHRGVGGEHQIGHAGRRRHEFDRGAELQELAIERGPFAVRGRAVDAVRRAPRRSGSIHGLMV